ncbi:hypothetical protein [Streptomyces sp. NBC_00094]|uniref:hypothetical protein n=1 Tax=Streptomyces sp. NBC_00094 TaxID=2903620 RepID=UPI0022583103|nr:hypothetical protein [Streptomyces sp. NBC_00094]MCX5395363.1 hypothetical protein [Streptomyces sp. NBC_00094]
MALADGVRRASRWQDAVRLLLLIDASAKPVSGDLSAPATAVGVVRTQVRLQKLDFWLRYPDCSFHQAPNQLIHLYEVLEFERLTTPAQLLLRDGPPLCPHASQVHEGVELSRQNATNEGHGRPPKGHLVHARSLETIP